VKLSADVPVVPMLREIGAVIVFTRNVARFKKGHLNFTALFQARDRSNRFRNTVM